MKPYLRDQVAGVQMLSHATWSQTSNYSLNLISLITRSRYSLLLKDDSLTE